MLKKFLKISAYALATLVVVAAGVWYFVLRPKPLPVSDEDRARLTLMPLPAEAHLSDGEFRIEPTLGIAWSGVVDSVAWRAGERFIANLSKLTAVTLGTSGTGLDIHIDSTAQPVQQLKENESYELIITTSQIKLHAATRYGVLRGLETLLQLAQASGDRQAFPVATIKDQPRYAWRGLMLDVSRHWIPKEAVLRNLEAMAAVKLNVLHWHLSDYQGFRMESKVFPKLHEAGSDGNYYTQDDIREVVAFARDRGIRVVPEFDLPGHSTGFLVGYPELGSAPGPYKIDTNFGILTPVLDPTREEVYDFLDKFIGEVSALFPDPFIHIGGDEVADEHWKNNASIQAFMKSHEIANSHDLQAHFNARMEKIFRQHGKRMAGWDEILHQDLSKDIVVQSWRSHKSLFEAVQKNGTAILSNGYYLDHKLHAGKHYTHDPEVLSGGVTIQPDSNRWQQYELTLHVNDNKIDISLVLFGEGAELRGVLNMMSNYTSFEKASLQQDQLAFTFPSDYGEISFESTLQGDSLKGKLGFGLLSFPLSGVKSGGHDVAGTHPPRLEQMKPLTADEQQRILGGEAAMWTEVVSMDNLDTRLWPRLAAIAEKFWTPKALTTQVDDMYRRLAITDQYLVRRGAAHHRQQDALINHLTQGKNAEAVRVLVDALEEVKLYDRLAQEMGHLSTLTPLNEVVDAALPESLPARTFNSQVHAYLADSTHRLHAAALRATLTQWRNNHHEIMMMAAENPRLQKVLNLSSTLGALSLAGLRIMDQLEGKVTITEGERAAWQKTLDKAAFGEAAVLLAVEPGLRELLTFH
ncbi:MAG: family 20 glycosylhydrolase [Cyclobacteriaceae bacterium]